MSKPDGLYPTLAETLDRYRKEHGVDVKSVTVVRYYRVPIDDPRCLQMLTKREKNGDGTDALDGRGIRIWNEKDGRWERAVIAVKPEAKEQEA